MPRLPGSKDDKRKNNGGARPGSGPKPKPEGERKVTLSFQVKQKHVATTRPKIQIIIDKINAK